MKRTALKAISASLILAATAFIATPASAALYEVSTPGLSGSYLLVPSADSFTLGASTASTSTLGNFAFQNGSYFVGDSGFTTGTFNYSVNESVTINGETQIVPLVATNRVSNPDQENQDSLSISQVSSVFFSNANVFFNFLTYNSPQIGAIGSTTPFQLTGFLAAGPAVVVPPTPPVSGEVPEPSSLMLMLAGALGLARLMKRRNA